MAFETLIDAHSLQSLADPNTVIVDCRFDLANPAAGFTAYLAGHIPGARYADLNSDLSAPVRPDSGRHPLPSPEALSKTLGRLGIEPNLQVIAYDALNGSFAARLWWLLRSLGHRKVAVLDGGLAAWQRAGGALRAGEESSGPKPPYPLSGLKSGETLDTQAIAASLENPDYVLVDARAPERFSGAVEPIDAVAGHIPGALNLPFLENLAADGTFLKPRELRSRWLELLDGRAAGELVAMCGSGVTACHNLLSLEVAGLPGAKLYPGSWSEWIRDANRPVARSG
jgi:thiosulfate/3-mercaptopyruvate sulfurtransferase